MYSVIERKSWNLSALVHTSNATRAGSNLRLEVMTTEKPVRVRGIKLRSASLQRHQLARLPTHARDR